MAKEKQSTKSRRYKSFDRHRFRKVFVWIIPIIISVSVGVVLVSKAEVFRWSVIVSVIILLGYLLFLLEWYVWRENPGRKRGRIGFLSLCLVVVVCGNLFQFWIPKSPTLFLLGERPNLSIEQAKLRVPKAGEKAVVGVTFHNRGEAPARSVSVAGKVEVRECCAPPNCTPVVHTSRWEPSENPEDTVAIGETKWIVFGSDIVLSENIVNRIMSGKAAVLFYAYTEYGRNGKATPYHSEYYAYYDAQLRLFVPCPYNNTAN